MHVDVNGARLWFDVEGPGLVLDGPSMREWPMLAEFVQRVSAAAETPMTNSSRDEL